MDNWVIEKRHTGGTEKSAREDEKCTISGTYRKTHRKTEVHIELVPPNISYILIPRILIVVVVGIVVSCA